MWLSLLLVALVVGILIRQAAQGLFSAFLTTVLTICCAALAFGSYEWVANHWLAPYWKSSYALPIALGVSFGVPLILLRLPFDRLIRRACLLPSLVDRIGAWTCGFVTAMITTGIVAICLQMLPFQNGSIIGYSRVGAVDPGRGGGTARRPDFDAKEKELLHRPDRFATFVGTLVLNGVFAGKQSFLEHNQDVVQTIGWVGAAHREVSRYAPPESISIVRTAPLDYVYKYTQGDPRANTEPRYEPETPKRGKFRMVRVKLSDRARDERRNHTFTLRQFRLVGRRPGEDSYEQYFPIAIQQEDKDDPTNRHIRYKNFGGTFAPVIDQKYAPRDGNHQEVEIVFEIPSAFRPAFLEYKREARVAVSFEKPRAAGRAPAPPPPPVERTASARTPGVSDQPTTTPPSAADATRSRRGRRPAPDTGGGGTVRGVGATVGQSHFGDELPMTMRSYQGLQNPEIAGEVLARGHLVGQVDQQAGGGDPPVSRFRVPEDKRLLQLSAQRLTSSSVYGEALNRAVTTVQNYYVEGAAGERYVVVGKHATATVRGRRYIEVQYFAEHAGSIGGLGRFRRIREQDLTANDQFVLLFLVDPGVRIVAFSTGGAASRRDDLMSDNLVAPP
jgi:hypothetical protein